MNAENRKALNTILKENENRNYSHFNVDNLFKMWIVDCFSILIKMD